MEITQKEASKRKKKRRPRRMAKIKRKNIRKKELMEMSVFVFVVF